MYGAKDPGGSSCCAERFRGLPVPPPTRPHSCYFLARWNRLAWVNSTGRGLLFHYLICRRKAEGENQEDDRQRSGGAPHFL
jgi:hypothetical protein